MPVRWPPPSTAFSAVLSRRPISGEVWAGERDRVGRRARPEWTGERDLSDCAWHGWDGYA